MKQIKIAFPFLLLFLVCTAFSLKKANSKPTYAFGFSTSFTVDSVAYFTEIQVLDSVFLEKKVFLPNRSSYSYQMKNFLEMQKGLKDCTCTMFFSTNKAKLLKEQNKLIDNHRKKKKMAVKKLESTDFKFVKPDVE